MRPQRCMNSSDDRRGSVHSMRASALVLLISAVLSGLLLWGSQVPRAGAVPAVPQAPSGTNPLPPCGDPNSTDELWNDVKNASPSAPGNNKLVVFPGGTDQSRGFAIHDGARGGAQYNWLLLATGRQEGIECPTLLQSDAPEYFLDAYNQRSFLPKGTDWALGIESADNRSKDQLHIHISRLQQAARTDIDNQWRNIATEESKWKDSVITVMGKKFRAWNVGSLEHNLFAHLNNDIVTPFKVQMRNQTMLVTECAPKTCTGLIVLNSDKVSPNTNPGADNIEFLLNKA